MPAINAELRDPIRAALRECRTLLATLLYTADTIRARTENRDAQIDLGVIQKLGGNMEITLHELDQLIAELLTDGSEALPVDPALDAAMDALRFYASKAGGDRAKKALALIEAMGDAE
jgi:hypothetical protein